MKRETQPKITEPLTAPLAGETIEPPQNKDTQDDLAPIVDAVVHSEPVLHALEAIQKGDTLDVYRRRLNGTSALATRVVSAAGVPATLLSVASNGAGFAAPTAFIAGTTLVAAGAVPPLITYAKQRIQEPRKAARRNKDQAVIREHLGDERLDIVRQKGNKKKGVHVRWYGADAPNGAPEDADAISGEVKKQTDTELVDRFAGITKFALMYGPGTIKSVVVSADILNKLPNGDPKKLREEYKDKLITEKAFFTETKGVKLHDRKSDKELLQLTPDEARKLVYENGHKGTLPLDEALANYLTTLYPDNVAAQAIKDWKVNQKNPVYQDVIVKELRASIERRLQSNSDPVVTREYVEHSRLIDDPDKPGQKKLVETLVPTSKLMDATLTLNKKGVQYFDSATLTDTQVSQVRAQSLSQLAGTDISELAKALATLSKKFDDAPNDKKHEYTTAETVIELALYHQLQQVEQPEVPARHKGVTIKTAASQEPTLYERLPAERPRTLILPRVAKRGKVAKADQTIEYGRKFWRNTGKKIGALGLAAVFAYGAGQAADEAWSWNSDREHSCDAETKHDFKTPEEEANHQDYCADNPLTDAISKVGKASEGTYHATTSYENTVIEKLYTSGLLSPDAIAELSGKVDEKWAAEKAKDLGQRYNLYSGSRSPTMNATISQNGDPTLWKLDPTGGAKTDGYWPSSTQDSIYINTLPSEQFRTPPLKEGALEFTQSTSKLVPTGQYVDEQYSNDVSYIRELNLPATPRDTNGPLIKVTGRQLLNSTSMDVRFYNPNGIHNFDESVRDKRLISDLPVIEGGDIVAANVVEKKLSTDEVVSQGLELQNFFQQEDGTYHLGIPYNALSEEKDYAEVTYWVKPHASTALPLSIKHPLTISQRGEPSRPLSEAVTPEDVASLYKQLGIAPNATFEDIAKAIRNSRSYSFTPYPKDAPDSRSIDLDKDPSVEIEIPTGKVAVDVTRYAANLPEADCNVARTLEAVISRGVGPNGEFIGGVTGFKNDGDNALTQTESHTYTRTNDKNDKDHGHNIDATPGSNGSTDSKKPEQLDFKDSPKPHSDVLGLTVKIIGDTINVGSTVPAGIKTFALIVDARRRRRELEEQERQRLIAEERQAKYDKALRYLPGNEPEDSPLTDKEKHQHARDFNDDLAVLSHVLYAPADAVLDEDKLSRDSIFVSNGGRSLEERLKDIPYNAAAGPAPLQKVIRQRIADGTLKISAKRAERLESILAHAFSIQNYAQTQDDQQVA
jgi:hypothetical protein